MFTEEQLRHMDANGTGTVNDTEAWLVQKLVELMDQRDNIEEWFNDGARAGELSELDLHDCPYPEGSLSRHWWTRGFSYTARLLRAIRAEMKS